MSLAMLCQWRGVCGAAQQRRPGRERARAWLSFCTAQQAACTAQPASRHACACVPQARSAHCPGVHSPHGVCEQAACTAAPARRQLVLGIKGSVA
eukprot:365718-Chlamydomonas_euryale.AAC.27